MALAPETQPLITLFLAVFLPRTPFIANSACTKHATELIYIFI
jgi:hypothetical protein